MTIDLIFIAYNRLDYTKLALPALLKDPTEEFSLVIWDNASTDGTQEYLSSVKDVRIVEKAFSKNNVGLRGAVNYLFNKSSADLVGIIPNDFIVTPGWTRKIAEAHADIPELGMIGCWHFFPEEFDYEKARHKIQQFGKHRILRHPWTGGNGLIKLKTVKEMGLLESDRTGGYLIRMALKGYINGFYFPLIYVEHMDDALSKHSRLHRMSFDEAYKYMPAYQDGEVTNREQLDWIHKRIIENLLTDPYDPKYYVGWRAKLRHIKQKLGRIFSA
jgi:glycosyltransferase involved in cell wall biosynthesis